MSFFHVEIEHLCIQTALLHSFSWNFSTVPVNKDKDEMIKMAIAMSLEGQSRVNENEHEENVGKSYCNVKYDK